jgi:polyhydroxyalkanoate synthesis regulator phasin
MQKKRKWIRKKTKEKIKKLLKEMIVKGYIYSNNEARRFGLEDRELKYYL